MRINCTTGETREFTPEEVAAQQAASVPRVPQEAEGFSFTPREFVEALLTAMVQENTLSNTKAQAIATRVRNALKR